MRITNDNDRSHAPLLTWQKLQGSAKKKFENNKLETITIDYHLNGTQGNIQTRQRQSNSFRSKELKPRERQFCMSVFKKKLLSK